MGITCSKGIAAVLFNSNDQSFRLDDLPEFLLVEILCRLPCKFVAQSKCVCKSWSTLISLPYFESRRALYHGDNLNSNQTIMFVKRSYFCGSRLFTLDSKQIPPKFKLILDFQPGTGQFVEATYNELILLREKVCSQINYYICNPYTKQWVAVPPTTSVTDSVGFICDSDYRCRIVRLLETIAEPDSQLLVEIFSSETGKWTKSVVICPQMLKPGDVKCIKPPLAYNGTLYWPGSGGFLIGLDPFSNNHNHDCQYISEPYPRLNKPDHNYCLGVCQGCVRMCQVVETSQGLSFTVWELKEEDDKKMKWSLNESVILDSISINPVSDRCCVLALDPNEEDIVYLKRISLDHAAHDDMFACNIRTNKGFHIEPFHIGDIFSMRRTFSFMLPGSGRWPTPLPKLENGVINDSSCPPQEIDFTNTYIRPAIFSLVLH